MTMSHRAGPARRLELRADVLALGILLSLSALYVWLTWGRCGPFTDPGWHMQVTARAVAGDVLYRDMYWDYGPLPVYVLGLLYRLLGVNVILLPVFQQALAVLACLLTYRVARFLLAPPLALLSTGAAFLGTWLAGGGYLSYIHAYTGALPLGTVLGLVLVASLLSYLQNRHVRWLVLAGIATGLAILTKIEFALACTGTGLLFLSWVAAFPASLGISRRRAMRDLLIYVLSAGTLVGIGYGISIYQAGWGAVWAGLSGYDLAPLIWAAVPPWGRPVSWCYIASGLGAWLLAVLALAVTLAPARARKHLVLLVALIALGLALAVLPWLLLATFDPAMWSAISTSSRLMRLATAFQVLWAPVPLLSLVLLTILGIHWYRTRVVTPGLRLSTGAVLLTYSTLVAVRYLFYPTSGIMFQQADTLFPVLVFSVVYFSPAILKQWLGIALRPSRVTLVVAGCLMAYAVVGFIFDIRQLFATDIKLVTPRGAVWVSAAYQERVDTLGHILAHTDPADAIVVLGFDPGFYFLSGRRNPLRQDMIIGGMGSSPAEAREMVERMKADPPRLVIIPRRIEDTGELSTGQPHAGREGYQNLQPVWQYVAKHYQVNAQIGGETGYVIYEPQTPSP